MGNRATFITIERPLIPQPPRNSRPFWCYSNTLLFYTKNASELLWEQKIPEALGLWHKNIHGKPEFDRVGHCEVFLDKRFGWQLRWTLSHETAKEVLKTILKSNQIKHLKIRGGIK